MGDFGDACAIVLAILLLCSGVLSPILGYATYVGMRRQAVEYRCAVWTMDPVTGSAEWNWKEPSHD